MIQRISVPNCSESSSPRKTLLLGLNENEGNKIFLNNEKEERNDSVTTHKTFILLRDFIKGCVFADM
jgi:hypothetical protein